jgi:hypothetical protein
MEGLPQAQEADFLSFVTEADPPAAIPPGSVK